MNDPELTGETEGAGVRHRTLKTLSEFRRFESKLEDTDLEKLTPEAAQALGATYIARLAEKTFMMGEPQGEEPDQITASFKSTSGGFQRAVADATRGDYLKTKIYLYEQSELARKTNERLGDVLARLSELTHEDGPNFEIPEPLATSRGGKLI